MIVVRSYPRIHVTLIDLAFATARRNGGVGFAIDGPPTIVEARSARTFQMSGFATLDSRAARDVESIVRSAQPDGRLPVHLRLASHPPQHVGFGTKTGLLLSCLEATLLATGKRPSRWHLQGLCGRGATSGIGINTYFCGGFLSDAGQKDRGEPFAPSSSRSARTVPPILSRIRGPDNWLVHLFLPVRHKTISGTAEIAAFKRLTPIPKAEALRVLASVYHGLLPAVADHDLESLHRSLADIHAVGFKARELSLQATSRVLVKTLLSAGIPAGMSSMGPLVYAITSVATEPDLEKVLNDGFTSRGFRNLGAFRCRNSGRDVVR